MKTETLEQEVNLYWFEKILYKIFFKKYLIIIEYSIIKQDGTVDEYESEVIKAFYGGIRENDLFDLRKEIEKQIRENTEDKIIINIKNIIKLRKF